MFTTLKIIMALLIASLIIRSCCQREPRLSEEYNQNGTLNSRRNLSLMRGFSRNRLPL